VTGTPCETKTRETSCVLVIGPVYFLRVMDDRELVRRAEAVRRREVAFFPRMEVVRFLNVLELLLFFAAPFLRLLISSIMMGHSQPPGSPILAPLRIDPIRIATVFRCCADPCLLIIYSSSISTIAKGACAVPHGRLLEALNQTDTYQEQGRA